MTIQEEIVWEAIIRANKLGAKGIQVVGFIDRCSATQNPELLLTIKMPEPMTAGEVAWYDK